MEREQEQTPQEEAPVPLAPGQPPDELATFRAELEEARRERDQFRSLLQRVQADFVNFKRRAEQEREEQRQQANAQLILRLLPVLDDLQRALGETEASRASPQWLDGVGLIHRKLQSVLEAEGVLPVEAEACPFDPFEHEAVLFVESGHQEEGTVLSVLQKGYKLRNRVLRTARVVVARRPRQQQGAEEKAPPGGGPLGVSEEPEGSAQASEQEE